MSRIFGIIFTVVFVLFFTTYQSSANKLQDRVEALEFERERIREEMKKGYLLEQQNSAEISRLRGNDFVLFFTTYQSLQDRVEALEFERGRIREEMKKGYLLEQQNSAEISRLRGNDKDADQIAELGQKRVELEKQLQHKEGMLVELSRVIDLPVKVVRGEATEEEIQECGTFFKFNCLTLPETTDPDWWLEHHP